MTSRQRVDYVYTRSASTARRTVATSGSSDSRLPLQGGTLVGHQRCRSWRRSAWVRLPFLTDRVEDRLVGRPAVGVRQSQRHQPHLPQDTDTVSCLQMSLAMSSVSLNRWQLQEATLVCRSICSTSAITGLTAVGDRQRGRYFASQSAPTTTLKAGITV